MRCQRRRAALVAGAGWEVDNEMSNYLQKNLISIVMIGIGAVALIVGIVLLITKPTKDDYTAVEAEYVANGIYSAHGVTPIVRFEVDGKTVQVECQPVSDDAVPAKPGEKIKIIYRRGRALNSDFYEARVVEGDSTSLKTGKYYSVIGWIFIVQGIIMILGRFLISKGRI